MEYNNHSRFTSFVARRISSTIGGRRSRTAFIVSLCGISLALFTVIATVSIVTGFKHELRNKLLAFNSTLSIYPVDDAIVNENDSQILEWLALAEHTDASVYNTFQKPALLKSQNSFENVVLTWEDDSTKIQYFGDFIIEGQPASGDSINLLTLSATTARKLNVGLGDKLDVVVPAGEGFKFRRLTVAGIYDTHFTDYDKSIAFASPAILKSLISGSHDNWGQKISVEYNFKEPQNLENDAIALQQIINLHYYNGQLQNRYAVGNITQNAGGYFAWLSLLDTNVVVIVILMIFIAAFTLVSSIIIIILERVPMIGILRAQGAQNKQIKSIFIKFGLKILLFSILIADVLAVSLILAQREFQFIGLNPDDYYLTYVPMEMNWWILLATNLAAIVIGLVSMLLPAMVVNRLPLTKAIKFN